MRRVVRRLPLPEHVIALGELQLAAGQPARRAAHARAGRRRAGAAGRRGRRHGRRDRGLRGRPRLAAARASRSRAARGPRRRASAPPTRWAGRSPAPDARPPGWRGRTARCGSARSTRCCASTPGSPRGAGATARPPRPARSRSPTDWRRTRGRPPPRAAHWRDSDEGRRLHRRARRAARAPRRPPVAHPLGNFSVNHQARVAVSADRVDVTYLLDQAEIPTFQERGRAPAAVLARKRAEILRGLALSRRAARCRWRRRAPRGSRFPAGQGGLRPRASSCGSPRERDTLGATVRLRDAHLRRPRRLEGDRRRARARARPCARASRPRTRPRGLRRYPQELLRSPPDAARGDVRRARRQRHGDRPARRRRRHDHDPRPLGRRLRRRARAAAPGCRCCCWPPRSAGARCTRSRPGTARRWSPPTWSARAARRGTRSRSGSPSR